jgi:hypothetical protein
MQAERGNRDDAYRLASLIPDRNWHQIELDSAESPSQGWVDRTTAEIARLNREIEKEGSYDGIAKALEALGAEADQCRAEAESVLRESEVPEDEIKRLVSEWLSPEPLNGPVNISL